MLWFQQSNILLKEMWFFVYFMFLKIFDIVPLNYAIYKTDMIANGVSSIFSQITSFNDKPITFKVLGVYSFESNKIFYR